MTARAAAPKTASGKPRPKRYRYYPFKPPISYARLDELIAELESDRPLPRRLRKELSTAIHSLKTMFSIEEDARTPGRRRAGKTRTAANRVHLLVTKHNATVKAAIVAVLVNTATVRNINRIARMYSKMKNENSFDLEIAKEYEDFFASRLQGNK